ILLDVITLMICIELEMRINKFCYYNIGEETTESIESLSLIKKLTVVHSILGKLPFKGTNIYELLREFVGWRNKYVHGKRPEIKHNEIHKNHFKESGDFKNIYDTVKEIIQRGEKFIEISEYLTENSISEYGKIMSCEDDDIKFVLDYTKKNYLSVY
ncbi:MAG: hypothetical protein M0P77_09920, partial [Firmicutes bacterium]|nr:hypothetical protein [Bacillota bacterium]